MVCLDFSKVFDTAQPERKRLRRDLIDVQTSGRVQRGQGQALVSGAQQQDERQWPQTETHEVL